MGHQPFQMGEARLPDGGHDLAGGGTCAHPAHAGINLEVIAHGPGSGAGQLVHLTKLFQGVDRRGQIEFHDGLALIGQEPAHHQDARTNTAATQGNAFLYRTDSQPMGAFSDQNAGHFQGAVAVSIGLDDSGDFHIGTHYGANTAVIAGNLLAGNQNVGTKGNGH